MFSPPMSVFSGSTGGVGISKKRSVYKKNALKTPVVFPETLVDINICAGPARSVSGRMRQAFGGYLGEPGHPRRMLAVLLLVPSTN